MFKYNFICHECGEPARPCEGALLRVGSKYFCSQEHMRDYLNKTLEQFNSRGYM